MGVLFLHWVLTSGDAKLEISVLMYPGETVLTRAKPVHSTARLLPVNDVISCPTFLWTLVDESHTKVDNSCLGAVVDGLQLGNVHNATTHGGGGNETTSNKVV